MKTARQQLKKAIVNPVDNPFTTLFLVDNKPMIRKADAKALNIPLYHGKACSKCGNDIRMNKDAGHFSAKSNCEGECYTCKQFAATRRSSKVRNYIKKYPVEYNRLMQLNIIRANLCILTGDEYHTHHIIPVSMKNSFPNSDHNESASNKIVVSKTEHDEIHRLIREGIDPNTALSTVVPEVTGRIVSPLFGLV